VSRQGGGDGVSYRGGGGYHLGNGEGFEGWANGCV